MMSKQKSRIILAGITIAAILMCALSYFGIGSNHILGVGNIKQGLDLQGGVTIVYEAKSDTMPSSEAMSSAVSIIRKRLDFMGSTEADVGQQGASRIRVEIPGVHDAEKAVSDIGQTAMLTFVDPEGNIVADGPHIKDAQVRVQQSGGSVNYVVGLEFDSEAAATFGAATARFKGQPISIRLDETEISAPTVESEITDGNAVITGNFSLESATELAALIRGGALPFKLEPISVYNVGAKLGADSLSTSLFAGVIGGALVLLFMLFIYRAAGIASDIALVIYLTLELLVLSLIGATLTLPGIAGIVLSIGMAVDANVIIFERLKEELRTGRPLRYAIDIAFKRAFSAILDGNVTTLIAAAVLFWLGSGPVKGFALTLGIGIVISMFSALVVTRILLKTIAGLGVTAPKYYGVKDTAKEGVKLDIVKNSKKFFIGSLTVIIIGIVFAVTNATSGSGSLNFDVEFSGGTSMHLFIGQSFDNDDIASVITEISGQTSPQIQKIFGKDEVMVKMRQLDQDIRTAIIAGIAEKYSLTPEEVIIEVQDISPTVSREMGTSAILAVAVACIAMLVYVSLRFRNVYTGSSAILALLHDALIMLCAYAILRIPVNYSFIAAILTVLGYSINATIVIFDRARENKKLDKNIDKAKLINDSVSQTFTRSVYTSLTTLFTIAALYVVGVQSIKEFALPIIVGILAGTYSSVFLSGSIWFTISPKDKA